MADRVIDLAASSIVIRTKAKGLLARLAHDLEIRADGFEGNVASDGERWQVDLTFAVNKLTVVGALKSGRVDSSVLSESDRREIERKIREEVFVGGAVTVSGSGKNDRGDLTVSAPAGKQSVQVRLDVKQDGGTTTASGSVQLSLARLGVKEIKAPLGAFKVADLVEVIARVVVT